MFNIPNNPINVHRSTVTITVTGTSTVKVASTVSAPAAFTPIRTSLPASTYGGSGGADPIGKREADDDILLKRASSKKPDLVPRAGHPKYPKDVSCHRWTHHSCATKVVTSTKTVTETTSTKLKTVRRTFQVPLGCQPLPGCEADFRGRSRLQQP